VSDEALLATMILDRNPGLAGTALWWLGVGPSLWRALTQAARVGADDDTSARWSVESKTERRVVDSGRRVAHTDTS
jgi:hypothetical protein